MLHVPSSVLSQSSSCAGVVYTVCEWLQALPFEVKSIWWNPDFPLHLRWIYILARYTGLLGQVSHLAAYNYLSTRTTAASRSTCNFYWFSQQSIGAFTLIMLQILLSKHVYGLWARDYRIGVLLCILLVAECVASVVFTALAAREMVYIGQDCFTVGFMPKPVLCLCAIETFVQTCLYSLALVKYAGLSQQPRSMKLFRMVLRFSCENGVVFALACFIPVWVVADGIWTRFGTQMATMSYLAFPIFLAITTSVTCRTIINLHHTSQTRFQDMPTGDDEEEGPVFTSIYSD